MPAVAGGECKRSSSFVIRSVCSARIGSPIWSIILSRGWIVLISPMMLTISVAAVGVVIRYTERNIKRGGRVESEKGFPAIPSPPFLRGCLSFGGTPIASVI